MSTREEERVWRRKVSALAERYEKRVRELARWAESLSRERAELNRECRRLATKVRRLEREKESTGRQFSCLECQLLTRFLGHAMEDAPDVAPIHTYQATREREKRILSLLGAEAG
ncbi:MAG: hypothetical protein ACYS99_14000 [Planctomycetota bacterium]|jgi:predicted nuclease with TOPRIM domain